MDKKAWIHQLKKQIEQRGEDKASWYVSWYDPDGKLKTKSCGPGKIGKSAAKSLADKRHAELITGTYQLNAKSTWDAFYGRYTEHVEARYDELSRQAAILGLKAFIRIVKPRLMKSITTDTIDKFINARKVEVIENKTKQTSRTISPSSVNRELRYVRAALRLGSDWGYITNVPKFRFLKPESKLPTFVKPECFTAIYAACESARRPVVDDMSPADWWRGLIVTAVMTGLRIGQLLAVRAEDVDFENETLLIRSDVTGNKGKREELIPIHRLVVEHLRKLVTSSDEFLFPWPHHRRTLWIEFAAIQEAAVMADGSPLPKGGKNGSRFAFHDLRRAFASANADNMDLFQLQKLMQHKSLETTKVYVAMAQRLKRPVQDLFVPELPKKEEE